MYSPEYCHSKYSTPWLNCSVLLLLPSVSSVFFVSISIRSHFFFLEYPVIWFCLHNWISCVTVLVLRSSVISKNVWDYFQIFRILRSKKIIFFRFRMNSIQIENILIENKKYITQNIEYIESYIYLTINGLRFPFCYVLLSVMITSMVLVLYFFHALIVIVIRIDFRICLFDLV